MEKRNGHTILSLIYTLFSGCHVFWNQQSGCRVIHNLSICLLSLSLSLPFFPMPWLKFWHFFIHCRDMTSLVNPDSFSRRRAVPPLIDGSGFESSSYRSVQIQSKFIAVKQKGLAMSGHCQSACKIDSISFQLHWIRKNAVPAARGRLSNDCLLNWANLWQIGLSRVGKNRKWLQISPREDFFYSLTILYKWPESYQLPAKTSTDFSWVFFKAMSL